MEVRQRLSTDSMLLLTNERNKMLGNPMQESSRTTIGCLQSSSYGMLTDVEFFHSPLLDLLTLDGHVKSLPLAKACITDTVLMLTFSVCNSGGSSESASVAFR